MATKEAETLVLVSKQNGIVVIPSATPLTRLNYFDGKFLRASDLKAEQNYLRHLVRLSNQAGGSGVVHGFDLTLGGGGDTLELGPGLGINPDGRVLLLPQGLSINIQELIDKSQELEKFFKKANVFATEDFVECEPTGAAPPITTTHSNDLYLITICPAEALCGEEDVYGKLCEEACATSTDRPLAIEGLIVRAIPLLLQTPLPHSMIVPISTKAHLRSRVASAYFEDERQRVASMISKFGLEQITWCLGAEPANGSCLPIGVLARAGFTTVFLDAWIARRERMDSPPRRYWQWRMMMRPWDVFLAQILQFQCQLRDLFGGGVVAEDPCGGARTVIGEAAKKIADMIVAYKELSDSQVFAGTADGQSKQDVLKAKITELESMSQKLSATEKEMTIPSGNRLLISGGIIELPSAGYLPIAVDGKATVNQQVQKMMGEGVDLRFCIVRPDYVAHALEEAQHMERISLIQGLEDPKKKPQVDILVPDGEFVTAEQAAPQLVYAVTAEMEPKATFISEPSEQTLTIPPIPFKGTARVEALADGGTAAYMSCSSTSLLTPLARGLDVAGWKQLATAPTAGGQQPRTGVWLDLRTDKDLMLLKAGDETNIKVEVVIADLEKLSEPALEIRATVEGTVKIDAPVSGKSEGDFSIKGFKFPDDTGKVDFKLTAKQPTATSIEIAFTSEKVKFLIEGNWSNPDQLSTNIKTAIAATEKSLFEFSFPASLSKDQSILSATNNNHLLAVKGLEIDAAGLGEQGFVVAKSNQLFPAAAPASQGQQIRATRDWVLFHRRRTKKCTTEAVATRSYRVYQLKPTEGTTGIELEVPKSGTWTKEALLKMDALWKTFVEPIGIATFDSGSASIAGDISALKSTWREVDQAKIVWGAIASSGAALNDGEAVATARLSSLGSQLDELAPTVRLDVLPMVPPALESPGLDGIIILLVGKRTVTQEEFRLQNSGVGGSNV